MYMIISKLHSFYKNKKLVLNNRFLNIKRRVGHAMEKQLIKILIYLLAY